MSTQRNYDERKLDNVVAGAASTKESTVIAKTEFYCKARLKVLKTAELRICAVAYN